MYFGCVCFRSELGFLNCDDICMYVVNKQVDLLEFVFDSVYVDLQFDLTSSSSSFITDFFHSSTHWLPTLLKVMRLSKEHGCASWEHCNMCAAVSSALPQAHVVSPV